MSTLVLVPGAGLGGWAWSRVTPLLRAAGHDPHPITLTGTGDRAHLNGPDIHLSTWVTDVVTHLETEDLRDVTLVGHSFCGTVISGVAARTPERLGHLVYLDALVPEDQRSVFDIIGSQQADFLRSLAGAHDGWSLPWFTDDQLDAFYGDHGLTRDDLTWMRRHITSQPLATYQEPLPLPESTVPRTYVRCTHTPTPSPVSSDAPRWGRRELDAGHWPMITAPQETAALLSELAQHVVP